MKLLTLVLGVMFLAGCASGPPSSVGLYGDVAGAQSVKGSNGQGVAKRTLEFTYDEVMDATETALLRKGINIEQKDRKMGRITGQSYAGTFPRVHNEFVATLAIYVKQVSPKPLTEVTVVVDRHTIAGWGGFENVPANEILGDIQKVLSTYR